MHESSQTSPRESAHEKFSAVVQRVLIEECALSARTRAYHWQVTGPNSHSLHKLLDEQRRQLDFWLQQVLERIRSAGVAIRDDLDDLARRAPAGAGPAGIKSARQMIDELLGRHEKMACLLRDEFDSGVPLIADLLARLADFHETTAWMLRIVLERPEAVPG